MGCTPSKSAVIYTQEKVSRDLDTCSTFVPSLKSSVSTPERPRLCVGSSNGRQTFLSGEFMMSCIWYSMKLSARPLGAVVTQLQKFISNISVKVSCHMGAQKKMELGKQPGEHISSFSIPAGAGSS